MNDESALCPRCGSPRPADGSPCPRCLMELAQSVDPQDETTALPPEDPVDLGTVGPYRLLSVLGEGGMGTVYLAEQRQPIQRRVALKLVRAGLAGREVLARFEAERQALALMTHPGIARVLDAGTTHNGAPYFVMEYVHGEPITTYCDKKRLALAERIALFRQACAAVQHAHQRGILHRDLKPSNILVEEIDGEPRARVIDFGLAKALHQRLTERTLFTERGQIVGTPEYMSPEQAAGEAFDVDTTTDVYSLGVVLYELLTGSLPHDPQRLRDAGWLGMMKILREEEPKKPSTQVSTFNKETASAVAERRRTEPRILTRSLAGDIDWILLKALDKERERRYANVSDLAVDIERHLADQPVLARPPSAAYQLRKMVRRHRLATAFVVTVAVLVATLALVLAAQARRIARERDRAVVAERASREVTALLVDTFRLSNPAESRGNTVTVREVLDRAAARAKSGVVQEPTVRLRLEDALGRAYTGLGLYRQAEPLLTAALDGRRTLDGGDGSETAESCLSLGRLRLEQGQLVEAEALARRALAIRRRAAPADRLAIAEAELLLGVVLSARGSPADPVETEQLLREALAARRTVLGEKHLLTAEAAHWLGGHLSWRMDDLAAGEPFLVQSLAVRRELLGDQDPLVALATQDLANHLFRKGDVARAESLSRETIALTEKFYGPWYDALFKPLNDLAILVSWRGNFDEAVALAERALEIRRTAVGGEAPEIGRFMLRNLGVFEASRNQLDAAEAHFRAAVAALRADEGARFYHVPEALGDLALVLEERGRPDEAEAALSEAVATMRTDPESNLRIAAEVDYHLARLLARRGARAAAAERFAEAVEWQRRSPPPNLGSGPFHTRQIAADNLVLGGCLFGLGRFAEAEPLLLAAVYGFTQVVGPRHVSTRRAQRVLDEFYREWKAS